MGPVDHEHGKSRRHVRVVQPREEEQQGEETDVESCVQCVVGEPELTRMGTQGRRMPVDLLLVTAQEGEEPQKHQGRRVPDAQAVGVANRSVDPAEAGEDGGDADGEEVPAVISARALE